MTFPHSAILFLRCGVSTPDTLKVRMVVPGGSFEYDIQVMKSQKYTLDEIFEKKLLLLIPFYIFSHEARFEKYETDKTELQTLQEEYEQIRHRLEKLSEDGAISEYIKCTIIDMSNKVLEHIATKYNSVREGVKSIMGGKILEYEAKTIRNNGIQEGIGQGIEGTVSILKGLNIPQQTIQTKIQEQYGLSPETAKKYL